MLITKQKQEIDESYLLSYLRVKYNVDNLIL